MKLGYKLILFALLCSVVPLLGMATLAFDAARSSIGEIIESDLESIAQQEIRNLENHLSDAHAHLTTWSRLGIMQDVLVDDFEGDLGDELIQLAEQYPLFAELLVVNSVGSVIASTDSAVREQEFQGHLAFQAPAPGVDFQGQLKYSNRLDRRIITFGVPIIADYNASASIGSLVGSIDWEVVEKNLTERAVFGGKQDPQRSIVLQSSVDNEVLYVTTGKQLSTNFLEKVPFNKGVLEQRIDQTNYVVASARSKEVAGVNDPSWILHVVLDTDIAYSSIQDLLNYMFLIGFAALLLVTILGYFLARAAVRPINALVLGAQGLADGDYDSPLPNHVHNDELGVLTNSFVSMRDAIRKKEQELIKRTEISEEGARLKGQFLANMSHEVRTPINGVLGMTELLMNTELDATQDRYASTIFRSGQSLLSVINDILDFSKIEAGKLELQFSAFDLRDVIEDALELVAESAHKKGIEISALLPPDAHVAYQGDASRVRQILINLLGNAIKFTSEGEVKLTVTSDDKSLSQSVLRFEVLDTGIGISEEAQNTIFQSFVQADGATTRKYGGSGLGLAISAQLSELMDGGIGVDSKFGVGSTFWFTTSVRKLSNTVQNAWQDSESLKGKRILIVDDNKTNREILQAQVEFWGADYLLTDGATQALSALRTAIQQKRPFDLAILDMHMPGMDGMSLTVAIKNDDSIADTRLILLSSVCDELDITSYRAIGLEAVLSKPVRQPELFQCLTAVITNTNISQKINTRINKMDFEPLNGRVLIAEDNLVNQELIREMMSLMGVDFHLVSNGQEAFDAFLTERFDMVLMDCQMPIADGFEATRLIRQHEKIHAPSTSIPIVALTANALQGDREICLERGMDEYLSKPVTSSRLYEMLGRWLPRRICESVPTPVNNVTTLKVVPAGTKMKDNAGDYEQDSLDEVDIPALDSVAFAQIAAISAQASAGFLSRLTHKFIESSASDIDKLEIMLSEGQSDEVRKLAHSLKGSSANLGAQQLAKLCHEIELAAAENTLQGIDVELDDIKSERDRVVDALQSECQRAA